MGTGDKNRAVQAGLPIVLAVLVATALLPAPASADHGEPHSQLDIVCEETGQCEIVDVCQPSFISICFDLSSPNAVLVEADPMDVEVQVRVDSYKRGTSGGEVYVSCLRKIATLDDWGVHDGGCWYLEQLGFQFHEIVLPWTGVDKTVGYDLHPETQPLLETCTAHVSAYVAGTGASQKLAVPCSIGG